jgi:hypothetical protein
VGTETESQVWIRAGGNGLPLTVVMGKPDWPDG